MSSSQKKKSIEPKSIITSLESNPIFQDSKVLQKSIDQIIKTFYQLDIGHMDIDETLAWKRVQQL